MDQFWADDELVYVGKEHFWVSIVVSSLGKGALADCFKRFPWFSTAVQTLFSGFIKKLLEDTRKHEAYSMGLVQRCACRPCYGVFFLPSSLSLTA